jgi:DNA-binding LacI/PurR family transcriptional regulator
MPKSRKGASIIEVAALAEVSIQTVSNVLNTPTRVTWKTREKVLKAIDELEYIPNLSARRLRSKKSSSLAVRLDANFTDESNLHGLAPGFIQNEFVYYLVEESNRRGIKVVAYTIDDEEPELLKLKTFMQSRDVDGIILTSTTENDERLSYLKSRNAPFLSFGRPWGAQDKFSTTNPWIDIDGRKGTSEATAMFWGKGKREIGFVGWQGHEPKGGEPRSTGEDRYLGWSEKISELQGKKLFKNELMAFGSESIESGRKAARELIKKSAELEAVVCVSDTLALGCLLELQKMGRSEIEVSGFDNSPISREFGFSSLDQELALVAEGALLILMGEEGNQIRRVDFSAEETLAHTLLSPKLIIR